MSATARHSRTVPLAYAERFAALRDTLPGAGLPWLGALREEAIARVRRTIEPKEGGRQMSPIPIPSLSTERRKPLLLSLLGIAAVAATGEGVRRRQRQSDSSEWAKKTIVVILALVAIGAILGAGARRRRAKADQGAVEGLDTGAHPGATGIDADLEGRVDSAVRGADGEPAVVSEEEVAS